MKPRSLFPKKHPRQTASVATLDTYWTLTTDQLFARLHTTSNGLQLTDAVAKLPWGISIDAAHRNDNFDESAFNKSEAGS